MYLDLSEFENCQFSLASERKLHGKMAETQFQIT
jgi:hypothetical protein